MQKHRILHHDKCVTKRIHDNEDSIYIKYIGSRMIAVRPKAVIICTR